MRAYFRDLRKQVIDALMSSGKEIEGVLAGTSRRKAQTLIAGGILKGVNPGKKGEAKRLRELFRTLVGQVVAEGGSESLASLGAAVVFNVNDPQVQAWLGDRLDLFSEEVAGTTFDAIDKILRDGFADGQPLSTIADTLRETFASWDKYRAPLIARTETVASLNRGSLFGVAQSGVADDVRKGWLTAQDEDVRETHAAAGKRYTKPIEVEEMFEVGGDRMLHPGGGLLPEENINCRCTNYYVRRKKKLLN
jgi:hypothetical protein